MNLLYLLHKFKLMDIFLTIGISLLAGIGSGLIASYIFLAVFLDKKRPDIRISEWISQDVIKGENNYLFKFVNSTNKEIFDVRIEATFYKPFGDMNGRNFQLKDIKLKDNFLAYIPCNLGNDDHNLHCARIRTTENLLDQWTDSSSFIRFTVIAKHSLTGLSKVFVKDFHHKDRITTKKFISGDELSVK